MGIEKTKNEQRWNILIYVFVVHLPLIRLERNEQTDVFSGGEWNEQILKTESFVLVTKSTLDPPLSWERLDKHTTDSKTE